MFLGAILVFIGFYFLVNSILKNAKKKKENTNRVFSDGEVLKNKYILEHEQKIIDDEVYEEYVDWCKVKGEIPVGKIGFDEHRMKEYHLYKKLIKHGIKGL